MALKVWNNLPGRYGTSISFSGDTIGFTPWWTADYGGGIEFSDSIIRAAMIYEPPGEQQHGIRGLYLYSLCEKIIPYTTFITR